MKNDNQKDICEKGHEKTTEKNGSIPFWTAFGWNSVPSNSKTRHKESKCPFSDDITYSVIDDSVAVFCGSGVLQGKYNFEPDEPDECEGIHYYYNCFGEDVESSVDWGSIWFTARGDVYNPNKWCVEVVIGDKITTIGRYSFYGLTAMRRVTMKGKNTVITDGEIPNNVIICAPSDSVAKLYAQQNGNPFEELKNPF